MIFKGYKSLQMNAAVRMLMRFNKIAEIICKVY